MVVDIIEDDPADYYNATDNPVYYYSIIYAYRQPFRVYMIYRIIPYVSVPVVSILYRVTGEEASHRGVIIPVT
jgi:hypothetical protein